MIFILRNLQITRPVPTTTTTTKDFPSNITSSVLAPLCFEILSNSDTFTNECFSQTFIILTGVFGGPQFQRRRRKTGAKNPNKI